MLTYSPLCDTDPVAYAAYLSANVNGGCDAFCDPTVGGGRLEDDGCESRGARSFELSGLRDSPFIGVLSMCGRFRAGRSLACGGVVRGCGVPSCEGCGNGCDGDDSGGRVFARRSIAFGDIVCDTSSATVGQTSTRVDTFGGPMPCGGGQLGGDDGGVAAQTGGVACTVDAAAELNRGPNYGRNVANREKKKRRKLREKESRVASGSVTGLGDLAKEPSALRDSLDAKRIAENKLAEATALRRLAVLEAVEVDDEVKRQRTRIAAMTEHNMVSMERDHAKLKATGNVPGLPGGGFAETVLTDGDTISPNSSASMADYRKCQKDLLDSVAEVEKLRAALERCGISADHIDKYDKSVWTDNIETFDALDAMYDDYVLEPEEFGDKLRLVDVGAYGSPMPKTARAGAVKLESKSVRAEEVVGAPETGVGGVSSGDAAHFRKTDGTLYTQLEALRWLGSYAYAGNKLDCGKSDADVARECNTTVGVLQKYRSLKARFGLMQ